jgi:hypothetical protein
MNERLKTLRLQAINYCMDKGSQGNLSEEVAEKFAGLIVRECADKCLAMAYVNPGPHHYAAMIKEHFGVE